MDMPSIAIVPPTPVPTWMQARPTISFVVMMGIGREGRISSGEENMENVGVELAKKGKKDGEGCWGCGNPVLESKFK